MAHGVSDVLNSEGSSVKIVIAKQENQHPHQQTVRKTVGVMGSRRIFAPAFKLKVLDSYRNDIDCRGNQRATARKYGIHRRQIQKWLQCEDNLRSSCPEIGAEATSTTNSNGILKSEENSGSDVSPSSPALNLSLARLHGDELLPVQQGSPPSRNSPLTAEFGFLPTLPLAPVGYTPDLPDLKFLPESERKFYISERYEHESPSGFRGDVKYQTLTPYQEESLSQIRNVDSPEDTRITVLNAPAEIKAERASPDSAATPGMYEMPGSPSASLVSFLSPHHQTPHFEPTQQSPSMHYVREHQHPYQDSKKPCCQEDEKRETKIELEFQKEEDGPDSYSTSSSPHGPVSSSSSCSESEIDAIDNSPTSELTRRRSFSLRFKINVLDAFHQDVIVSGNQRATARKFGINRRQVQKWLGQETELRGEIARRGGNSRQRLGSNDYKLPEEAPVDLRTGGLYCCETSPTRLCSLSCCTDNAICYQENFSNFKTNKDTNQYYNNITPSDNKRSASDFCCYRVTPSPKKLCLEGAKQTHLPPQETPLCLVKPKMNPQIEIVSSTVQTGPIAPVTTSTPPSSKKDAILFKPYLDNPISKPTDHGLSMMNTNNNNNCQGICNLNEGRGYDYALELSLRVPISWRAQHTSYCDFPSPVRSAFVRYPTSPHYT
ncbi:uncharacterized protein LOC122500359 [Leptopilina heterotoma]|uniref:uncharacterized protein LOC122500359 n=1 Tax=Leptopilina heterotoma TaxID=63436 RepID=UPI001CA92176|nr:uncharacterized protein LOC122500359 [Leptopilina heterotoma]